MLRTSIWKLALGVVAGAILAASMADTADAQRRDADLKRVAVEQIRPGDARVSIRIGRDQGRFNAITLRVLDRPIEMKGVVIIFGNGERQPLRIGQWFAERQTTELIELDGRRPRFIERIEIGIRPLPRDRSAKIVVLGDAAPVRDPVIARQSVKPGDQRVTLRVPRGDQRLSSIAIQAERQSFYLRRAEVTFENGRTEVYRIRRTLEAGQKTPSLSFGDQPRRVERVDVFIRAPERSRVPGELLLIGDEEPDKGRRADRITRDDGPRPRIEEENLRGEWLRLGSQSAARFDDETDVFNVGRDAGRFQAIRVKARRHDVLIKSIRVTYGNGESEDVPIRGKLRDEEESDPFVFDGRGRAIDKVTFRYQTTFNLKGSAVVELWGLK